MMRASRGVRTWPETVQKAEALDQIIPLVDAYVLSGGNERDILLDIVAIIETKAAHAFPRSMPVINPDDSKGRA